QPQTPFSVLPLHSPFAIFTEDRRRLGKGKTANSVFGFASALAFRYLCTREKKYLPKTTRMKSAEFSRRKIWNITYPVLISLLMEHLIGMTDTAFMGHVGEVELGA